MKTCYFCGRELDVRGTVGRDDTCPHCRRDLRCCLNCVLYDVSSSYCREPQSEEVRDRERSNFCDFFVFGDRQGGDENGERVRGAKERWKELFKK